MRIRNFKESVNYIKLLEFIKSNLSFLLDDFAININDDYKVLLDSGNVIKIEVYQIWIQPKGDTMKWEDIKLDFIPFFEIFRRKYDVLEQITIADGVKNHYHIDDDLENEIHGKSLISFIKFDIRKSETVMKLT